MLKIGTAQISNRKAPSASLTGASELLIMGFTDFVTPIPLYSFFIYDREGTAKPSSPPSMRQISVLPVRSAEEPRTLTDGGDGGRHPSFAASLSPMGGKRLCDPHLARLKPSGVSAGGRSPSTLPPSSFVPLSFLGLSQPTLFSDTDHSLRMLSEIWESCPRDSETHERNATASTSKQRAERFARQHHPLLSTS